MRGGTGARRHCVVSFEKEPVGVLLMASAVRLEPDWVVVLDEGKVKQHSNSIELL